MKNFLLKLVAISLASAASLAHAKDEAKQNVEIFDAPTLAYICLNCHSTTANNNSANGFAIPALSSRDAETIYQQMVAFQQSPLPPNTTIMNRLLAAFNEDELKAIAKAVANINGK